MKLSDLLAFLESPDGFDILYQGKKVEYLNEAGSPSDDSKFFVAGHEFGATTLVHVEAYGRGDGFESAYGAWIDSCETIPESELVEAYGPPGSPNGSFLDMAYAESRENGARYGSPEWDAQIAKDHERAKEMMDAAVAAAIESGDDYPDLIEGYRQQDNASGTGIVDEGHYASFCEADPDDIELVRKAAVAA